MKIREIIQIVLFAAHLYLVFVVLIPSIGNSISHQCLAHWRCSRFMIPVVLSDEGGITYVVDGADNQWKEFRSSLLLLAAVGLLSSFGRVVVKYIFTGNEKIDQIVTAYRLIVGCAFIAVLHGKMAVLVLLLALCGYFLFDLVGGSSFGFGLIWFFGLSVLGLKESYRILHWPVFELLTPLFDRSNGGMYSWHLSANFLVLRMISYGLDLHWARLSISGDDKDTYNDSTADSNSITTRLTRFSFLNYCSYIVYAPLYFGGPIQSFESFAESEARSLLNPALRYQEILLYALRWLFCLALLEYLTSKFPFFAIIRSGLFSRLKLSELAVVTYVTLKIMWLKFLVIWRFFRLWAMMDGVCPPENMKRCMSNNHALGEFWRGWHASFNQWILRYLYHPLGGRNSRFWTVWLVFLFVAAWHDIEPKLIVWGALNALFYLVEVNAQQLFSSSPFFQSKSVVIRELIRTVGGGLFILVLMTVNLIGYAVGVAGINVIIEKLYSWEGLRVVSVCFYFLCWAVRFMNYLRDNGLASR